MTVALAGLRAAAGEFAFDGTEFRPVGILPGDQGNASLALGSTGGIIVWEDNATDGDGLGISGRRITATGSPLGSVFRINENGERDQEHPKAAVLPDGSSVVVWLGGEVGRQSVYARIIGADGLFKGGDLLISAGSDNCQDVSVAALTDGSAAVVWASDQADGKMLGVFARRIDPEGAPKLEMIRVNQFTDYNQRSPAIAAGDGGSFFVTWISEQQTGALRADVYGRRFTALGTADGAEFRVNASTDVCATPTVQISPEREHWFAWSQRGTDSGSAAWDVYLRRFDRQMRPLGMPTRINQVISGSQLSPKLSFAGSHALAVWTSDGNDGSDKGIAGVFLDGNGETSGDEIVVNTGKAGDQVEAEVASGGYQRWMVTWTDWTGYEDGTDLHAQRIGPAGTPLDGLATVFGDSVSAWQVSFSWLEPVGVSVDRYEISFDDGTPISVAENYWISPDVLPGSRHSARVRFVHQDGRISPWSNPVEAQSWGKDLNGDGMPDDWQQAYFGSEPATWPGGSLDSDGDGVSNRNEFLSGTSPVDEDDVLKVRVTSDPLGLRIVWNGRPGSFYQLQASENLVGWSNVDSPRLAAGSSDSILVQGPEGSAYYRIKRVR